jgi:hypothetical protein
VFCCRATKIVLAAEPFRCIVAPAEGRQDPIMTRLTRHRVRPARLLALSMACLLGAPLLRAGAAAPPAPEPPSNRFDGTYIGMPTADRQNRSPPCARPETAVLDVQNGTARMRSSLDRRTGVVQPDGTLAMKGLLSVASQQIPGFVDGRFTADHFVGTSRFPNVNCVYHWDLAKPH